MNCSRTPCRTRSAAKLLGQRGRTSARYRFVSMVRAAGQAERKHRHNHHHRQTGPTLVKFVKVVMVYCYGRRIHRCPMRKGAFLAIFQCGGARAQHFATDCHKNKVCRVCGSHPVPRAMGWNAASALTCAGCSGGATLRTEVRTGFAGLHPECTKTARDGNSMLTRVCERFVAGNRQISHPPDGLRTACAA